MDRPTQASSLRITESPELRYSLIQGKCGLDKVWQRANGQGLTYSMQPRFNHYNHMYAYIYTWVHVFTVFSKTSLLDGSQRYNLLSPSRYLKPTEE